MLLTSSMYLILNIFLKVSMFDELAFMRFFCLILLLIVFELVKGGRKTDGCKQ